MRPVISIDFDGVLHDYSAGWTGYRPEGAPIPGAAEFVGDLQHAGYEVIISSCRAYTQIGREGIREWLLQHGFGRLEVTCEKPHAVCYIDDRAVRFEGSFADIRGQIERKPWFVAREEPHFDA